jgi:uncharacterized protein
MVIRLLLFAIASLVVISCNGENSEVDVAAFADLMEMRQDKDAFFKSDSKSPLPIDERDGFEGLNYYDPDTAYVVEAIFEPSASTDTFLMQTTTDQVRNAIKAGTFVFTVNGQEGRLAAYEFVGSEHQSYFVPFKDATNRSETYKTGRYLDIEVGEDNAYLLDFNMAYNPYCAYNENYSCPLVPAENELPFPIKAGERSWR